MSWIADTMNAGGPVAWATAMAIAGGALLKWLPSPRDRWEAQRKHTRPTIKGSRTSERRPRVGLEVTKPADAGTFVESDP